MKTHENIRWCGGYTITQPPIGAPSIGKKFQNWIKINYLISEGKYARLSCHIIYPVIHVISKGKLFQELISRKIVLSGRYCADRLGCQDLHLRRRKNRLSWPYVKNPFNHASNIASFGGKVTIIRRTILFQEVTFISVEECLRLLTQNFYYLSHTSIRPLGSIAGVGWVRRNQTKKNVHCTMYNHVNQYTHKNRFPFYFKLNGIDHEVIEQNEIPFVWFKTGRKTVTTIICHAIWKEMRIYFSFLTIDS